MPRTGRPRMFDRDDAVQQAMMLFWDIGFDLTSLARLKAAMGGISAASFYAAFSSKEVLFDEVLARYLNSYGQVTSSLRDESLPPRRAIEQTLRRSAKMQTDRTHPPGCLLVLAMATCAPESELLQKALAKERARNRVGFLTCVRRAVEREELPRSTDITALGAMFDTFLLGMSIKARDGATFKELDAATTQVLSVWDTLAAAAH